MLHACLAAKCVTGLLLDMYANVCTGTNPQELLRTVVWKGIWRLENFLQCIGRTARMPGQTGNNIILIQSFFAYTRAYCYAHPHSRIMPLRLSPGTAKLMTWQQAVQKCAGSEFARLAARPSSFVQEAVRIVNCDNYSKNTRAQNVRLDGTGVQATLS